VREGSEIQERMFELALLDEEGNKVSLSQYWQTKPTVFVWMRHFG
jgi:hypothetical protein